jgi:aspartate aminotransferase-like enzyme
MDTFNFSTGPVQLTDATLTAMYAGPSTSHDAQAQHEIAETLDLIARAIELPSDFTVVALPGSIRQALDLTIGTVVPPGGRVASVVTGYWGRLIAEFATTHGADVTEYTPAEAAAGVDGCDVFTAVHVETEFGEVLPLEPALAAARAAGAMTIVDTACSVPVDPLDFTDVDILVLGSHKCLGGAPGLGIVALRDSVLEERKRMPGRSWAFDAYAADAVAKRAFTRGERSSPSAEPPLVTYPVQVMASVRGALKERLELGVTAADHARAAKHLRDGLRAGGFEPYGRESGWSNAVIRVDVDAGVDVEQLRAFARERGFFVIGNIGSSAGGSVRVGAMSLAQLEEAAVEGVVNALTDGLQVARKPLEPTV